MRLENDASDIFEMQVVGYQFPENADNAWDASWLQVQVSVTAGKRAWTITDPLLMAGEVQLLAEWLQTAEMGASLEFEEPYLAFALQESATGKSIRVALNAWLVGSWRPDDGVGEELYLDFPLPGPILDKAVQSLKTQLAQYPPRSGSGD